MLWFNPTKTYSGIYKSTLEVKIPQDTMHGLSRREVHVYKTINMPRNGTPPLIRTLLVAPKMSAVEGSITATCTCTCSSLLCLMHVIEPLQSIHAYNDIVHL